MSNEKPLSPAAKKVIAEAGKDTPVLKPKKPAKVKKPAPETAEEFAETAVDLGPEPATVEEFNEMAGDARAEMPEPDVDEVITATAPTPAKPKTKRVEIFIDNEVGYPNYKFVGVGGKPYQIMRGQPVIVPVGVVEVLTNATITRLVMDERGNRSTITHIATPFRVLRYID